MMSSNDSNSNQNTNNVINRRKTTKLVASSKSKNKHQQQNHYNSNNSNSNNVTATTTANDAPSEKSEQSEELVIPFISCCQDGSYVVSDEAIEFLSSIEGPFGVIAMVGPYRTGKSTLLNRCILQEQIFKGGSTINACTKGILLVKKILNGPYNKATNACLPVIVVDTEGLGSIDATNTHDVRIFSMALLLSSLFIYNSVGSIDENAISTLSLVTSCCDMLKLDNNNEQSVDQPIIDNDAQVLSNAQALGKHAFPPLLWLVRDFALQLLDPYGEPISSKQYLEQALQSIALPTSIGNSNSSSSNLIRDKNHVRSTIKNCFPLRQCITMVRPVEDERQLQQLSHDMNVKVRSTFQEQLDSVRQIVFTNIEQKSIGGTAITGRGLVTYAKSIVDAINNGQQPIIRDVWSQVAESQCRDAIAIAKASFYKNLEQTNGCATTAAAANSHTNGNNKECSNTTTTVSLEAVRHKLQSNAIAVFKSRPMPTGHMQQKFLEELKLFLSDEIDKWEQQISSLQINEIESKLNICIHTIEHILLSYNNITSFCNNNNAIESSIQQPSDFIGQLVNALSEMRTHLISITNQISIPSSAAKTTVAATDSYSGTNSNYINSVNIRLSLISSVCSRYVDHQIRWVHTLASIVEKFITYKTQQIATAQQYEHKIQELEQKLEESELLQSTTTSLANYATEKANYDDMREKLTTEMQCLSKRAIDAEASVVSLEQVVKEKTIELESRSNSYDLECNQLKEQVLLLQNEISECQNRIAANSTESRNLDVAAQERYADQLRQFKLSVDELRNQHSIELNQYKEQSEKRIDEAERRALQYDAARKQVLQIITELRTENKQQQDERLIEQIDWSHRIAEAEGIRANMVNVKRKCDEEHGPALKKLKTLQTEHTSLQSELKFAMHESQRLSKHLAEKTSSLERLQDQYNADKLKHQEELLRSALGLHQSSALGLHQSSYLSPTSSSNNAIIPHQLK